MKTVASIIQESVSGLCGKIGKGLTAFGPRVHVGLVDPAKTKLNEQAVLC